MLINFNCFHGDFFKKEKQLKFVCEHINHLMIVCSVGGLLISQMERPLMIPRTERVENIIRVTGQ